MKPSAIAEMTDEELSRTLAESKRESFNLRLQSQTGQLENTARIREVRRDIARMLTDLNRRANQ
jgi:large subunit ribosomal protein L29